MIEATEDLYRNDWFSFVTRPFGNDAAATGGDRVRVAFRDRPDDPVVDVLWTDDDYRAAFADAGFETVAEFRPLGQPNDPLPWRTELERAPWVIYVLRP